MFDTTNQTEATLNMTEEQDYSEVFEQLVKDDELSYDEHRGKEDDFADFGEEQDNQSESEPVDRYKVVYNGKEMFLDLEELKTNAQKGLNYDHVKNEYDILRAQPGARELLSDARKSGLSSEAYLAKQKLRDKRVRVEDLMKRGVGESEALYVTDLEDKLEQNRIREEEKKPFYDFLKAYPGVSAEDISPEVWQRFHAGQDLVSAYAICENEKLKRESIAKKQNEENDLRSVGSAVGSVSDTTYDSFLEGLLG